jgi:hypothetical protein
MRGLSALSFSYFWTQVSLAIITQIRLRSRIVFRVILCTIGIVLLHIATTDDDNDRAAAAGSIARKLVMALESAPHRMRERRAGMRAGMHDAWNGSSSPGYRRRNRERDGNGRQAKELRHHGFSKGDRLEPRSVKVSIKENALFSV